MTAGRKGPFGRSSTVPALGPSADSVLDGSSGHSAAGEEAPSSPLLRPGPPWAAGSPSSAPLWLWRLWRQDPGPQGGEEAPLCPGTQLSDALPQVEGKFEHGGCEALVDEVPGQAALGEARGSRKAGPRQGLPLNNWRPNAGAALACSRGRPLPHPWQEEHAVPGSWHESHKQTREGVGWQPATLPRPQESEVKRGGRGPQGEKTIWTLPPVSEEERRRRAGKPGAGTPKATQQVPSPPQSLPRSPSMPTLRSVLRIQMKVQTRGLLADLSTMKPPGPFSPLRREALVGDLEPGETPDPRSAPTHLGLGWKQEGSCWSEQGPKRVSQTPQDTAPHPTCYGVLESSSNSLLMFAQPQGQGAYHLPALI